MIKYNFINKGSLKKFLATAILFTLLLTAAAPARAAEGGASAWAGEAINAAISCNFVPDNLQSDDQAPMTRAEFAQISMQFLAVEFGYDMSYQRLEGHQNEFEPDGYYWVERLIDDYCRVRNDRDGLPFDQKRYVSPEYGSVEPWSAAFNSVFDAFNDPFCDVAGHGLRFYVYAAYAFGLVNGTSASTFAPDAPITRQEAAAMPARVYRVYSGSPLEGGEPISFSDQSGIAGWAQEDVTAVAALHIMGDTGNGLFEPEGLYTREQCITTFLRLYQDAPVGRLQGNITPIYSYEEQLERIVHPESSAFLEVGRFELPDCTIVHGWQSRRHGYYYQIYLVYKNGFAKQVLGPSWESGSIWEPVNLRLNEDQTELRFSIVLEKDFIWEFQVQKPKGSDHYCVNLKDGFVTMTSEYPAGL